MHRTPIRNPTLHAQSIARRTSLISELTPSIRALHPDASWKDLADRIAAEVDLRLLYERFGSEP